jgi:hypothetical protein
LTNGNVETGHKSENLPENFYRYQKLRRPRLIRRGNAIRRVSATIGPTEAYVRLRSDPGRVTIAGVSNLDIAAALSTAMTGHTLASLRRGDKQMERSPKLIGEEGRADCHAISPAFRSIFYLLRLAHAVHCVETSGLQ